MFLQLEHNTPEIYSEESRDFQLLCRILDIFLNALIERTSKIPYNASTDTIDEDLLYLLARRLGFTTHKYFPTNILKNICENFPYLIRYKGTVKAIREAVYTVLSANQDVVDLEVDIDNNYNINISSNASAADLDYIGELLTFLVPAGTQWSYTSLVRIEKIFTGIIENLSGEHPADRSRLNRSRLRGIGESVSRIIKDSNWELEDPGSSDLGYANNTVPSRNWTNESIPENTVSPVRFYSRVNVAKIVKAEPANNGVILEFMNGEKGNPIFVESTGDNNP